MESGKIASRNCGNEKGEAVLVFRRHRHARQDEKLCVYKQRCPVQLSGDSATGTKNKVNKVFYNYF